MSLFRVVLATVTLAACGGPSDDFAADAATQTPDADARPDGGPPDTAPARIAVTPGTLLLTGPGDVGVLSASVLDAEGNVLPAGVTWRTMDASIATISTEGVVSAAGPIGSVQLFAEIGDLRSAPIVVLVATPTAGARLVRDDQVIDGPSAVDPEAPFGPGSRARVVVRGETFEPGQIVIGTGDKPVAGRVAEVTRSGEDSAMVLEVVALADLFEALEIDEQIPLLGDAIVVADDIVDSYDVTRDGDAYVLTPKVSERPRPAQATGTRRLGPFECAATGQIQIALADTTPSLRITPLLSYDVRWAGGALERLTVSGSIEQRFELKPRVSSAFEAKIECMVELFFIRIPLGGPVGLFVGGQVPVGAGFEVGGKVTLANLGVDVTAGMTASAEIGIDCATGACEPVTEAGIAPQTSVSWMLPDPAGDFRFEPTIAAFLYVDLEIGNPFLRGLALNAVKSKAGVRLAGNLAPLAAQAADSAYASSYALAGFFEIGAGTAIQAFFDLLQISLANPLSYTIELPIARSPAGSFTLSPGELDIGDEAEAVVRLDADRLRFLGLENVDAVEIHRLVGDALELETTIDATGPGQTEFTWTWVPEEADRGRQTFVAFVRDSLLTLVPLEVAADARVNVDVGSGVVEIDAFLARVSSSYRLECEEDDPVSAVEALTVGSATGGTLPAGGSTSNGATAPCLGETLASEGDAATAITAVTEGSVWTFRLGASCSNTRHAFVPEEDDPRPIVRAAGADAASGEFDLTISGGDLRYTLSASLSSGGSGDGSVHARLTDAFGTVAGPFQGGVVSTTGVLAPGSYRISAALECGGVADEEDPGPHSNSANYDVTLRLMP